MLGKQTEAIEIVYIQAITSKPKTYHLKSNTFSIDLVGTLFLRQSLMPLYLK